MGVKGLLMAVLTVISLLPGAALATGCSPKESPPPVLEFGELAADDEPARWQNELGRWKPATGVIDGEELALSSRYFKRNTYVVQDSTGAAMLVFEWDEVGRQLSEQVTTRLLGQPMAIFTDYETLRSEDGMPIAPIIQQTIHDTGFIFGLSMNEANRLSERVNFGLLP